MAAWKGAGWSGAGAWGGGAASWGGAAASGGWGKGAKSGKSGKAGGEDDSEKSAGGAKAAGKSATAAVQKSGEVKKPAGIGAVRAPAQKVQTPTAAAAGKITPAAVTPASAGSGAKRPASVTPGTAANKKPVTGAAGGAAAAATGADGKVVLNVSTNLKGDAVTVVVRTIVGTFEEQGESHGKKYYKKKEKVEDYEDLTVFLYYWDDRDGADFSGWWFGDQVGGTQVFARCLNHAPNPPKFGWKVPWDAEKVQPGALVIETKKANTAGAGIATAKAPSQPKGPPPASVLKQAAAAPAAAKKEAAAAGAWEAKITEQTEAVEAAVAAAKESMASAKEVAAAAEENGSGAVEAMQALQESQETLKATSNELNAQIVKAKAAGPAAGGAFLSLSKLTPRLRSIQATLTIEINKVKGPALRAEALAKQEKEKEQKAKQDAVNAGKVLGKQVPAAADAVAHAEDAVESVAILVEPVMNMAMDEVDEGVLASVVEIEKAGTEANTKISTANKAVNLALMTVKRLGVATNKASQEELEVLKTRLEEATKKLQPLKKFKAEFDVKMKGRKAFLQMSSKLSDIEVELEKASMTLDKGADVSMEDLSSVEAALLKIQPGTSTILKQIEAKLKGPDGQAMKEELEAMLKRAKECSTKTETFTKNLNAHREGAKRKQLMEISKEKVDKAEELVIKAEEAEAPFKEGASSLSDEEAAKALKTTETATGMAEKGIGQARGFLKQKLMDVKRQPEDQQKSMEEELNQLVEKVEEASKKLAAMTKETFEKKYSSLFAEVLGGLSAAEDKTEVLKGHCDAVQDKGLAVESLKEAGEKAQAAEKEASQAVSDAKKGLDAKIKELKGKSAAAVSQLQGRLQVVTQEVAKLRKVSTSTEKLIKARGALSEEESKMKAVEESVEKVKKLAEAGDDITDEAALELEEVASEALKVFKASAKSLEELSKVAPVKDVKDAVQDLVERNKKATTMLEEARTKTKGKREQALCGKYLKEIETKIKEVEAALDVAGDAELPFLSGVEVLPVDEATETLASCDKAANEVAGLISKARTYITSKSVEMKRHGTETSKAAIEEISKQQERLKGNSDRLNRFKKDIGGHRRKADLHEAAEKLSAAEAEIEKVAETVKECDKADGDELNQEAAAEICAKVAEVSTKVETSIAEVQKVIEAQKKDPDKDKYAAEEIEKLESRLEKATTDLDSANKVAGEYEAKFVAKKLLADAKGKIQGADDAVAAVTEACAPLLEQGGEPFLVAAAVETVVSALSQHIADKSLSKEALFEKANGGKADGELGEEAFASYLAGLNAELEREDLDFSEERRKAMFKHVVDNTAKSESGGISCHAFGEMFRRRYTVLKNITLTTAFEIAASKTVSKLEAGDVLEALGESKIEEATGMTRIECKLLSKDLKGFVTTKGNQGTEYLEGISPYKTFLQDIDKQIAAASQTAKQVSTWITQSTESLAEAAKVDAQLKEARAELLKLKPKAIETQTKLEKLKKLMAAKKTEYTKKEQAERNAHIEKVERAEAEAITGPAIAKFEVFASALQKLEDAAKPLLSLKAAEQKDFATPLALQTECDDLATALGEAAESATASLKEAMDNEKVSKATGTGPLAEAKKSLNEMKTKLNAAEKKRASMKKEITAGCRTIAEAAQTKLIAALRGEVASLGVSLDTYFDKLAEGGTISEEAMAKHVESMEGVSLQPEHAKLACRSLQAGGIGRRRFVEFLQVYYSVVKEIALTADLDISKSKPIRKAEAGEVIELIEGPTTVEEMGMQRIRGRALRDALECWITLSGNKGTPFLKETPKPFLACTRETPMDKDMDGKDGVVQTLSAEDILEVVEGPRKMQAALEDESRARVKALKDAQPGFLTVRDQMGTVFAEPSDKYYSCATITGITDAFDMSTCKVIRKLTIGEVVEAIEEPQEEEEKGIKRVHCRALKDDVTGWVAMSGTKGSTTVYLKPTNKHYILKREAVLAKTPTGSSSVHRTLSEGEVVEILAGPKSEKVVQPERVKCKLSSDDSVVGWITAGNARACKAFHRCKKATAMHEAETAGADAKVVRQIEADEVLEPLGAVKQVDEAFRLHCRAAKDGATGWVTVKDKASAYVTAA